MKMIMSLFVVFLAPLFAFAQDLELPPGLLEQLISLMAEGKYVAAVGGVVVLLVYLFRKFAMPKLNLGSGLLPLLSLGLGALAGVGANLLGGMDASEAIKIVLFSGAFASTLWSALLKLILKKD